MSIHRRRHRRYAREQSANKTGREPRERKAEWLVERCEISRSAAVEMQHLAPPPVQCFPQNDLEKHWFQATKANNRGDRAAPMAEFFIVGISETANGRMAAEGCLF